MLNTAKPANHLIQQQSLRIIYMIKLGALIFGLTARCQTSTIKASSRFALRIALSFGFPF